MLNQLYCRIALVASIVLLANGCEKLTSKHRIVHAEGQTFLLEEKSGEVKLIQGAAIIPIKVVDGSATDARIWPPQNLPNLGNVKLAIKTKYRDGSMLYAVSATPFKGTLEKAWIGSTAAISPTLLLDLMDKDQFRIGETISLSVSNATRIVDSKDVVMGLSWSGSQRMSVDAYQDATDPDVRWAGFDFFIERAKE
jgi:hypothetical protein